jgi:hypothetical protein
MRRLGIKVIESTEKYRRSCSLRGRDRPNAGVNTQPFSPPSLVCVDVPTDLTDSSARPSGNHGYVSVYVHNNLVNAQVGRGIAVQVFDVSLYRPYFSGVPS